MMALDVDGQIERFVRALDWPSPEAFEHELEGHDPALIRWFESRIRGVGWLQVNIISVPHACVYALRGRLCSGWHQFQLADDSTVLANEASRLAPFLHARHYTHPAGRSEFRAKHPECAGYTWKKLHTEGPPYMIYGRRRRRAENEDSQC